MRKIGFLKSSKDNEKRIALLPNDIDLIENKSQLYFEEGYGLSLNISDDFYLSKGVNVVSREQVYTCDCIIDPKIGDANYLDLIESKKIIFGYFHAVQNKELTQNLIDNKHTCYAWEDMEFKGRHIFWRNNELAGEAAILHAFNYFGKTPHNLNVAVIGRGNVARGALRILDSLGANVKVFNRHMENLLRDEIKEFDVIVNAVLWDTSRKDHIVYKSDLLRMKDDSFIIDISCDRNGAIESCIPTTMLSPTYVENGVLHYCVDHTPSILFKKASESFSSEITQYIDCFVEGTEDENEVLNNCKIIDKGNIIDERINIFQNR